MRKQTYLSHWTYFSLGVAQRWKLGGQDQVESTLSGLATIIE